jgi:ribonuclease-3
VGIAVSTEGPEILLQKLLGELGVTPRNPEIYRVAMTHSSYLNEQDLPTWQGNERLEFLGDAVIGLVVTEALYSRFPEDREGALSKIKSVVVSRAVLAQKSRDLGLGEPLLLGVGETKAGGGKRQSILAAVFESFVGALYLDLGFEAAREFVRKHLDPAIEEVGSGDRAQDHKSKFQELAQRITGSIPRYTVVQSDGPDHEKWFAVEVHMKGTVLGHGEGSSKKSAEQMAAKQALAMVRVKGERILTDAIEASRKNGA